MNKIITSHALHVGDKEVEVHLEGYQGNETYASNLNCTGLTEWPVAEVVTSALCRRQSGLRKGRVLELGCGLGLCGITAGLCVGEEGLVVLSDGDEEVVGLAEANLKLNSLTSHCSAISLWWGDISAGAAVIKQFTNNEGFDVIVASDCLYGASKDTARLFFQTISMLLKGPPGRCNKELPSAADKAAEAQRGDNPFGYWQSGDAELVNHRPPIVILGYTRRLSGGEEDIHAMLLHAEEWGLQWTVAADGIVDIFGNETSVRTVLWEHCVFLVTWKGGEEKGAGTSPNKHLL